MTNPAGLEVKLFKGLRDDENSKNIAADYLYKVKNYNFPDTGVLGLEKILMPQRKLQVGSDDIDGLFEYKFLDASNVLQTQYIIVTNGSIYRTTDITATPTMLKTGLTAGKCSFTIFNDKLYIANGIDNVQVYDGQLADTMLNAWKGFGYSETELNTFIEAGNASYVREIGAPFAYISSVTAGSFVQATWYYYIMTYVQSGGEEIVGTVSNKIYPHQLESNGTVTVILPLGYTGTTSRKLYRVRNVAGPTPCELITTIGNNTVTTYDDTTASAANISIPTTNNAMPKPFFLTVAFQKLVGGKITDYPTQLAVSETNVETWDLASNIDISNYGSDNTAITGIGNDFNKVIVGTERNIYLVDLSESTATVSLTRANVGIKNGYTVKTVPAFGDFPGGAMFVSSLNDVRLMSGLQELPVATSLDNVRTENWAQVIRGSLEGELASITSIHAEFFKNKYHLALNGKKFVFDIRTQGWTTHDIITASYSSSPIILAKLGNYLYNGQANGWIEQEYAQTTYRSEDVEAFIQSPHIAVADRYKFIEKIVLWFIPSASNEVQFTITTDDNSEFEETLTFQILAKAHFTILGGAYNTDNFSKNFYDVDLAGMDYRVININKNCRWLQFTMSNEIGNVTFQGFKIYGQEFANKEKIQ